MISAWAIVYKKNNEIVYWNGCLGVFDSWKDAEFNRLFYPAKKDMKVKKVMILVFKGEEKR